MNAKRSRQSEGSVLLMSVFIMAALVGAGLTMAGLVRLQISQSRNEDNALKARYVAESGAERGLDLLSAHRLQTQIGAPTNLTDTLSIIEALGGSLLGGLGEYTFDPARTSEQVISVLFSLSELESKQIDLFDVNNPYVANPYPVESLSVDWIEADSCTAGTSEMEMTITQFDLSGANVITTPQEIIVPCGSFAPTSGFDCRLETNVPAAPNNYEIRMKSRTCDIIYGEFMAYSFDGTPVGSEQTITSHSILTVLGNVGHSTSTLQVSAPWRPTPVGFLDYVLFVEGDLVK